jgi:thioredoxin-like negative regulator of GroEL
MKKEGLTPDQMSDILNKKSGVLGIFKRSSDMRELEDASARGEELAKRTEGKVIIGKIDVDNNDDVVSQFGIRNIPTILFFKDGVVVDKQVGAAPKATFVAKIDALL